MIPEVWEAWTEDGHDLDEDRSPYGRGDVRFKSGLLLMFGEKATAENTAPFCHRCWKYLRPRAVTLDWLCELRDRQAAMRQPGNLDQWMPAEVSRFYEEGIGASRHIVADDSDPSAELQRISYLSREAFHKFLYKPYRKIPGPKRYISDPVKEEVFERDGGQCVKCGSTRDLQFDHIIPYSRGGSNSAANIQILCGDCNRAKGSWLVS
ncbi:HNH endonuclease [Actinocatenispora rupis]|uniref:HNH endonuclease n=1 Tax=Actinocatenispora rupis TaxID=519421 RepID=UPI001944BB18|nr:HNH endonuclease [Actinocatenispora rupis]